MKFMKPVVLVLLALLLAACSPSVKVRSDTDPDVNFSSYDSFNFFSQMGVEGDNYSNLVGQHFRDAITKEMTARGFEKSSTPGLQINVSAATEDKVRVNTYNDPYVYGGYYGYRGYGWGNPWGYGGGTQTTVRQYTEANIYIDLVDATEHKLVWQGVATFTLSDKVQENVRESVFTTVSSVFEQFPVAAPASAQ